MKLKHKQLMKSLGDRFSFAIVINFYIWLFAAMFYGKGKVTVYFNHFNEATFEYIMYIVIFPIMVYAMWWDLREYRKKKKSKKTKTIKKPQRI